MNEQVDKVTRLLLEYLHKPKIVWINSNERTIRRFSIDETQLILDLGNGKLNKKEIEAIKKFITEKIKDHSITNVLGITMIPSPPQLFLSHTCNIQILYLLDIISPLRHRLNETLKLSILSDSEKNALFSYYNTTYIAEISIDDPIIRHLSHVKKGDVIMEMDNKNRINFRSVV